MNENTAHLSAPAQHALPRITAIFITGLLLTGGCSKSDAPAAKASDTPKQEATKASDAPKKESAEAQEATKLAVKCAEEHWVMQENGALWFGYAGNPANFPTCNVQFKPVAAPQLVPEEISEADRLNGVEWHGAANFSASAYRSQLPDKSWADWQPWTLRTFWSVKLEKRDGNWTADEQMALVSRGHSGAVEIGYYSLKSSKPVTEVK